MTSNQADVKKKNQSHFIQLQFSQSRKYSSQFSYNYSFFTEQVFSKRGSSNSPFMSSLKSLQQQASSEHLSLKNKSIQGKIFDQSILQCLRGDEDQTSAINNNSGLQIQVNEEMKYRASESSLPLYLHDQRRFVDLDEFTNCQTTNLSHNNNQVLLNHKTSKQTSTINNISDRYQEELEKDLELRAQIKQVSLQKINQDSLNNLNKYFPNFANISLSDKQVEPGVEQDVQEVSADSQTIGMQLQTLQIPQIKIQSPVAMSQTSQKNLNASSVHFRNQSKALTTIIEKDQLENYEKGAQIIKKVISKSMTRVQIINKHVQNFIQNLKYKMNGRKLPSLFEKEYKLFNDVTHFYQKKRSSLFLPHIFLRVFLMTKLKIPLPVFMPTNSLRVYWDVFQVIFTYGFIYLYSILIFFYNQEEDTQFIKLLFQYTFFVFLLDTLVNFNTAYFDKDLVISNRKLIAWKYISSSLFLTDCINLMVMGSKVILQSNDLVYNPQNKLSTQLFNLLTFLKLNGIKPKRNRFSYVFTLTENQKHIMRLFDQLLSVISVAHAVWYQLGMYEIQNGYSVCWIEKFGFQDLSYLERYIYSIYWSITTMTTVGYGDISASNYVEALFITLVMIMFSCVFAYSINNIGFILQEIQKSSKQLNDNMTTIQRYLNRKNVNLSLQSRVRHYLSFLAEEQKDRNQQAEREILGILSNKLRDEITVEINTRILKKNSIFTANFSTQTLRKLVFIMQEVLIAPNEIIFEEGEIDEDQSIYFIENGIIEIYQPFGNSSSCSSNSNYSQDRTHLLQSLRKNQFFGEISFFSGLPRKASARSVNLSTLYKINRKNFIALIEDNPEDFERFKMMEEQIKFQQDLSCIHIECYSCNQPGHLTTNCPRIHQTFDRQFKILKNNFSIFQDRNSDEVKRRLKNKLFSGRYQIQKKKEFCQTLKENIRNYNSYTEIIFQSDLDLFAEEEYQSEEQEEDEDDQDQESNQSSQQQNTESSESSSNSDYDQVDAGCSASPLEQKKNHNSNNNEKRKTFKKGKTKKLVSTSSKCINSIKMEENRQDSQSSYKDIECTDNLEQYLFREQNAATLNPHPAKSAFATNSDIEMDHQGMKKSSSLREKVSEQYHSTQRQSIERGLEETKEVMQSTQEQIQSMNQTKSSNMKPINITQRTNSSLRENSNLSILENIANNSKINLSNTNNEEKSNSLRKQKNRKIGKQVTYKNKSNDEINSSDEKIKQQMKTKSVSKLQKTQTTDKVVRPSIEVMLSNAFHSAYSLNQQSEINRIEKSLNQLEEKMQSFSQMISLKTMKQFDQSFPQIPTNKKSTIKSHSSSIFKKLSGYNQDFRLSQVNQNLLTSNHPKENISENSIKFSQQCIRPPSQQQLENPQSVQMLERISKFLGLQGSIMNIFKHGNTIEQSQVLNHLSMDYFDQLMDFKKFFPHNNLSNILLHFKLKKQANKKQKNKTQLQIQKQRRQNVVFEQTSSRKSQFCNAVFQNHFPSEFDIDSYKPTYLSYGVSQQGDIIYPKNLIKFEQENIVSNSIY